MEGVLERVAGVTRFTKYTTFASLEVPSGSAAEKARKLLEKAEHVCLISNSVNGERSLVADVTVAADVTGRGLTPARRSSGPARPPLRRPGVFQAVAANFPDW